MSDLFDPLVSVIDPRPALRRLACRLIGHRRRPAPVWLFQYRVVCTRCGAVQTYAGTWVR